MSTGTTVVCASCGQTTTVPFEPRGDRPVYCKSCYRPKQGGGGVAADGKAGEAVGAAAGVIATGTASGTEPRVKLNQVA